MALTLIRLIFAVMYGVVLYKGFKDNALLKSKDYLIVSIILEISMSILNALEPGPDNTINIVLAFAFGIFAAIDISRLLNLKDKNNNHKE